LFGGLLLALTVGSFPAFALGHNPVALLAAAAAAATPFATQIKLLAIAGSVYAILQVVKQVFPVAGLGAVILNIVLSALGVVVLIKPDSLFSLPTLTAVAIAAIGAAGAHGTIKSFAGTQPPSSASKSLAMLALCALIMPSIVGCSPLEVQAYRIVVGAKAFTKSVGKSHPECGTRGADDKWVSAHNTAGVCVALDKAIAGKDVLIDLAETYCASPQFDSGGACTPPSDKTVKSQLAAKLQAAISLYGQTEADLKGLLK